MTRHLHSVPTDPAAADATDVNAGGVRTVVLMAFRRDGARFPWAEAVQAVFDGDLEPDELSVVVSEPRVAPPGRLAA